MKTHLPTRSLNSHAHRSIRALLFPLLIMCTLSQAQVQQASPTLINAEAWSSNPRYLNLTTTDSEDAARVATLLGVKNPRGIDDKVRTALKEIFVSPNSDKQLERIGRQGRKGFFGLPWRPKHATTQAVLEEIWESRALNKEAMNDLLKNLRARDLTGQEVVDALVVKMTLPLTPLADSKRQANQTQEALVTILQDPNAVRLLDIGLGYDGILLKHADFFMNGGVAKHTPLAAVFAAVATRASQSNDSDDKAHVVSVLRAMAAQRLELVDRGTIAPFVAWMKGEFATVEQILNRYNLRSFPPSAIGAVLAAYIKSKDSAPEEATEIVYGFLKNRYYDKHALMVILDLPEIQEILNVENCTQAAKQLRAKAKRFSNIRKTLKELT